MVTCPNVTDANEVDLFLETPHFSAPSVFGWLSLADYVGSSMVVCELDGEHPLLLNCLHNSITSWFLSLDHGNHVSLFCRSWVWIQGTRLWPSITLTELPETGTWWNTEKSSENKVNGSAGRSNQSFWLVLQTCCRNRRCWNQIFRFRVDKNSRTGFIWYLLSSEETSADFKNIVTRTHV